MKSIKNTEKSEYLEVFLDCIKWSCDYNEDELEQLKTFFEKYFALNPPYANEIDKLFKEMVRIDRIRY